MYKKDRNNGLNIVHRRTAPLGAPQYWGRYGRYGRCIAIVSRGHLCRKFAIKCLRLFASLPAITSVNI